MLTRSLVKCRFRTTWEIFADLKKSCEAQQQNGDGDTRRQPVALFLGGGMAAGKSTVREIIGKDVFWSSVSHLTGYRSSPKPGRVTCMLSGSPGTKYG